MSIKINITELRELTCRLLSNIEKQGNQSVQIGPDLYWDMPCKHRYDTGVTTDKAAVNLITPSLNDALTKVNQILQGTLPDSVGALIYIAPLLMAIGEEFLKQANPTYCR
ncbi:MAG: hypothetical protein ACLQPD_05295 [Desulfomonilaceae bacterium]